MLLQQAKIVTKGGNYPFGDFSFLAVDAPGVRLKQHRDGVAGSAGNLGGGTPEFSHNDSAA